MTKIGLHIFVFKGLTQPFKRSLIEIRIILLILSNDYLFRFFNFSCFRDNPLPQAQRSSNVVLFKSVRTLLQRTEGACAPPKDILVLSYGAALLLIVTVIVCCP